MAIEGAGAVPFLGQFLRRGGETGEEAALALGSSHLPAAFDILHEAWKGARNPDFRAVLARAISLSRLDRALAWLLDLVSNGRRADAIAAIEALALHSSSEEVRRRVATAVEQREPELQAEFRKQFSVEN
jgi:hypothetical protein